MDITKQRLDRRVIDGGISQRRPIRARYIACSERLFPELKDGPALLGTRILADCRPMAAIKGLLQQLGALAAPSSQAHAESVQLVLGSAIDDANTKLLQNLTELGRGQTRPKTMEQCRPGSKSQIRRRRPGRSAGSWPSPDRTGFCTGAPGRKSAS